MKNLLRKLRIQRETKEKKVNIKEVVKILPHGRGWIVNGEKIEK